MRSALAAPALNNQPPVVSSVMVGTPDQHTGVITGSVTATDPGGNPLTYSLGGSQPSGGSVAVNPNGTFTFTPTTAARLAAAQTPGPDYTNFTVAVNDGTSTTTTTVKVAVLPATVAASNSAATTGSTPQGVAVVGTNAYVANQGAGTVSVINTTTNTVVKTIAVGSLPTGVAASPDQSKVYVANGWSNTVSVIDTSTNTVTGTIAVGSGPVAVTVSPDGSKLYVADLSGNSVSVVNAATGAPISTVYVSAYPNGVAVSPDGTRLYVSNQYGYNVSVINTATNAVVATVPVGVTPSSVAVSATRALVTNQGGNSVSVIDTTAPTAAVIATITLPAGSGPTSVVLSQDGTLAYVANSNDTVSVIDMTTATPTVVGTVQIDPTVVNGAHTLGLNPAGTGVYATGAANNTLRAVSLIRGNTAPIAGTPTQTNVDPNTGVVTGQLNFTDTDGDTLSYSVPTQPASGTVTVNSAGTYTFSPTTAARNAAGSSGPTSVTFTVTASDGIAAPVAETVSAPITPSQPVTPQPPVAGTPTQTSANPITGVITGALNFTDPNGETLTYAVPSQPAAGTVTVNSTGTYTFTPTSAARTAAAGSGPTSTTFTVTASDGVDAAVPESVSAPILPPAVVTLPPVAGTPTVTSQDGTSGVVSGNLNFTDPNGLPLTYTVSSQPSSGTVTVNNTTGGYTFTPTAAARLAAASTVGPVTNSFTVAANDGTSTTTTTVTVPVLPANVVLKGAPATTGTTPMGLAVVGTNAYVANQGAGTVSVIDTTTNTSVKTIAVGSLPTGVAASPDQTKVYVANEWSNTVSVIDTSTNTVTGTIAVGSNPVAVAVNPSGSRLYVTNLAGNSVSVVDTATGTVVNTVYVGAYPNGVAVSPNGSRVYVTNQYSYSVSVIDTATNTVVATVPVGYTPSSVAVSATRAVVTNQGSNSVSVIDTTTATPTVIATITLPTGAPTSVVLSKDGTAAYVANTDDTVSVINLTTSTPAVVRTVSTDTAITPYGTHTLALSSDGARAYLTDSTDNALRTLELTSTVTFAHAPLAIPGGNGYTVDATWYFPNQSQPPVGLIYLQHGYTRTAANGQALAMDLAEQTNSIVVTPNISSTYGDPYYIWDTPIQRAVATMFEGNRAELTASASAAAGQPIVLPQQFVLGGGSAGGNLVLGAAEYLADDRATANLKAVILFDTTDSDQTTAGLAKLSGANPVPVMLISAPPCSCNNFGAQTQTLLNNAPAQFIGVMLDNGSHLDGEGTNTDAAVVSACGGAPVLPQNAAAAQVITAGWVNDVFTGSHNGIYGPNGAVIPIGSATARVIGVGSQPISA